MKLGMLLAEYPHKRMKRRDYTEKHVFSHFLAVEKDQVEATDEVRQTTTPNNKEADKKRIMERFPKAFDGECRPMNGPPFHFVVKDGAILVVMRGSCPVAVPLIPKLKEELDTLLQNKISPRKWRHGSTQ